MSYVDLRKGDCLELIKSLPDESVDLIITDPPYGTIKSNGYKKSYNKGPKSKYTDPTYLDWDVVVDVDEMLREFGRVLRYRGIALVFGQSTYTQKLRSSIKSPLCYDGALYWIKNDFSNFLSVNSAPANYVEDITIISKQYRDNRNLRNYARKVLDFIGVSRSQVKKDLGHQKVEHFLSSVNPNYIQLGLPSEIAYNELVNYYNLKNMDGYLTYNELKDHVALKRIHKTFNLPDGETHFPNFIQMKREYGKRYHPTQKPVLLLERLVHVYSNPGDVVLDTFMGSGSTGVACINEGRNFIGMEMDDGFFGVATDRLKEHLAIVESDVDLIITK